MANSSARTRPLAPAVPRPGPPVPLPARLAVGAGQAAAALSRVCGLGSGAMIGGRVARALRPSILRELSQGRTVLLVTGTNGKTTTTHLLAGALGPNVAHNSSGANMLDGLVSALAHEPTARRAALEVDERYLPVALSATSPAVVVLLNLSRDQLDRVGEVGRTLRIWRKALAARPTTTVVANCDDPLVTWAALAVDHQVWVAAGAPWRADSVGCPSCGATLVRAGADWHCRCGLRRPRPDWRLTEPDQVTGPNNAHGRLTPRLPGAVNVRNALVAVAAASRAGIPFDQAAARVAAVDDVAGRYRVAAYRGRKVRIMLAKNPAGWVEMLNLLREGRRPLVLSVNAREPDGRDLSWLWDVPFEQLRGRHITVCGDRAADLAVRLSHAEVAYRLLADPRAAIDGLPEGEVDLVANYTAFRDVNRVVTGAA